VPVSNKLLISLFFIGSICNCVFSQSFHIKLTDSANNKIDLAYLKIYCGAGQDSLADYKIIRNGILLYKVKDNCKILRLLITASGYDEYNFWFNSEQNKGDSVLCVLTKTNIKSLTPVVISAKRSPVQVKNDTTFYKASAFKDGTERKLEDLLKKLPGITVNDKSGEVRFKGKPVETVLLEGDDLFGSNYTLGTKNINANIVTEVQAIENYSDNYVLKGLDKEEKVALNVKISNSKLKISGNSENALGFIQDDKAAVDVSANLLGLQPVHKFFTTVSYNNIGYNKSPIDYFGNNLSVEQVRDRKYTAEKFIAEPAFSFFSDESRANFNSQFFGNYNGLFRIAKKITLKANLFYISDNIKNSQTFQNEYYFNSDTILNRDLTQSEKSPYTYKGDLSLRYNLSSKSLLEVASSYSGETTESNVVSISNFIPVYKTDLNSGNLFNKNIATYTQRLNKNYALQIEIRSVRNDISQEYDILPSVYKRNIYAGDKQIGDYNKQYLQGLATIYGVRKKFKYTFFLKGSVDRNDYMGRVVNDSVSINVASFLNDVQYKKKSIAQGVTFNFELGKWKFLSAYTISYLSQSLLNRLNSKIEEDVSFFVEPIFKARYILSKISSLNISYSLNQKPDVEKHVFESNILQNFRNAVNNSPSLDLISTHSVNLSYFRSDLYNQFDNAVGVSFQSKTKDYLPLYEITDSLLYTTFLMEEVRNRGIDLYAYSVKYLSTLQASVKVSLNHSINLYNNFLYSAVLRENVSRSTTGSFFCKTIFNRCVNFENEFVYSVSRSGNVGSNIISNKSIENNFKTIYKPGKLVKMFIVGDYYLPNLNTKKGFVFLDYHLAIKTKKKEMEFKVIARNLLNNGNFFQYQVSDFSRSQFSTNVIPRNISLSFSFQF
jgi:hypothetical protein